MAGGKCKRAILGSEMRFGFIAAAFQRIADIRTEMMQAHKPCTEMNTHVSPMCAFALVLWVLLHLAEDGFEDARDCRRFDEELHPGVFVDT